MRITSILVKGFGIVLLAIAITENNVSASEPRAVLSPRALPLVSSNTKRAVGRNHHVMSLGSLETKDQGRRPSRAVGHVLNLTHGKVNPDAPDVNTIPHWSDSFTYNGLVYNYTMVGTDPKRGSATTVVPTVLIPLRFIFADGNVFDATTDIVEGQTPVQGIINSPIFQNYDFNRTGVNVGNTQWGDAFQRANFWNSVSTRSPNYHVLLEQPTVLPVQTVNVPYGSFDYYYDPVLGPEPLVDTQLLLDLTNPLLIAAHVSPDTLPIIVWGQVRGTTEPDSQGFHGITSLTGNDIQTVIAITYYPGFFVQFPNVSGVFSQDIYILSHEIIEWMDNPFGSSLTPGWDIPFLSPADARCDSTPLASDRMEVADPVNLFFESDIPLPGGTFTYHVTDAVFIDWFTRSPRSRSYNGQYDMFEIGLTLEQWGKLTPPSPVCTGHVEFTPTYVDFPGATFTTVNGINNAGLAVGFYDDPAGAQHGFTFNGSNYSTLDFPGALLTDPSKINDAGMIVGTFTDATFGVHGFSYRHGVWTQLDFPGSFDTEVYGVNAAGNIVGVYDGTQPITHAFSLRNSQYQRIDTPFGTQSEAFAINNIGSITGIGYTDPFNGPFTPFIDTRNGFSTFEFPGSLLTGLQSINNRGDLAGNFLDPEVVGEWSQCTGIRTRFMPMCLETTTSTASADTFSILVPVGFEDLSVPCRFRDMAIS